MISIFSALQEYASQIKGQIIKDFSYMKEYVERQERNTLMFIEQQQKAAQQKIEETIHQLTDIKAQTVSDEMRWQDMSRNSGSLSGIAEYVQSTFEVRTAPFS